jgi:hypothetical protein
MPLTVKLVPRYDENSSRREVTQKAPSVELEGVVVLEVDVELELEVELSASKGSVLDSSATGQLPPRLEAHSRLETDQLSSQGVQSEHALDVFGGHSIALHILGTCGAEVLGGRFENVLRTWLAGAERRHPFIKDGNDRCV